VKKIENRHIFLIHIMLTLLFLGQIFEKLCGYTGFYTENIMISFDNDRLHTANKEDMRKQRKLINLTGTNNDTSEEDNTNASDTDDVSADDGNSDDETSDNNDDNDDETSDNNDDNDDEKDNDNDENSDDKNDQNRHVEDLYYNPKSRKWKHSDDDN
jgi:hypothetical protein